MAEQHLKIWVLFKGTRDRPKEWSVRVFENDRPTDVVFDADTREECEAHVLEQYPDGYWMPRHASDDPVIVGSWI